MSQKWNAETVVSAIQLLHQRGERLNSNHVQKERVALYHAAYKYWGSWKKAVEASGLSYDSIKVKTPHRKVVWSKDIIVESIKSLSEKGEPLNSNHVQLKHHRLYRAACKYFQGWPQAIAASGLSYASLRKRTLRTWTRQSIVEAVIERAQAGKPMNGPAVAADDRGLHSAAKRHFGRGGWAHVRVLAGLAPVDPDPRRIWDDQTIVQEILRLHENDVSLNSGALQTSQYAYILAAGRRFYGTWEKAVVAAGLNYEEIRKGRNNFWTKAEVIKSIKDLDALNIRLNSKAIQSSRGDLFGAAITHFGCWSEAVEAASISYRKHCRIWSTKAWLRRMHPEEYQAVLDRSRQHAQTRRRLKP